MSDEDDPIKKLRKIELKGYADSTVEVLNEKAVETINFVFGGLWVSGDGLKNVATAIKKGTIKVARDDNQKAEAQYIAEEDTIKFNGKPDFTNVRFRALLVHEAVHALIDMVVATQTRRLAGEAAAFLSQSIYLWKRLGETKFRSDNQELLKSSDPDDRSTGAIFDACASLIAKSRMWIPGFFRFSPTVYENLIKAIKADPSYSGIGWNEKVTADGIGIKTASAAEPRSEGQAKSPSPLGIASAEGPFMSGGSSRKGLLGMG
jgi:hypothetical protein